RGGGRIRRDPAGEVPDHSGIPLRPLCRAGDPDPPVPPRGLAASPLARLPAERRELAVSAPLLRCAGLTCRFGGVVALDRVDFDVGEGEIVGLIGPNGSGKTTLFNVVTGIYRADAGTVAFGDMDIARASAQAICRAGITRTFQRSRMCLPLSVFDNIMIGNHKCLNH